MTNWIIICNPSMYDIERAFNENDTIPWKMNNYKYEVGDILYIYVTGNKKAVKYKVEVTEINQTIESPPDKEYYTGLHYTSDDKYMIVKLLSIYSDDFLSLQTLRQNGVGSVQGSSKVKEKLQVLINRLESTEFMENLLLKEVNDEEFDNQEVNHYIPIPEEVPEMITINQVKSYKRNPLKAKKALVRANHICEVDARHPSFERRSSEVPYSEPHHLIPISRQADFDSSLDVEANIICLCSNCHNQIHYGKGYEQLLSTLWEKRYNELAQAGILIEKEKLLEYYN